MKCNDAFPPQVREQEKESCGEAIMNMYNGVVSDNGFSSGAYVKAYVAPCSPCVRDNNVGQYAVPRLDVFGLFFDMGAVIRVQLLVLGESFVGPHVGYY